MERALYEGWFYGAKYFFFEQGTFFGTFDRLWSSKGKYIILGEDGKLTEYGQAIQRFYTFLQNQNKLEYDQPNYRSSVAVIIGQSGWSSRGSDWGLWFQSDRQGDFDYNLLNLFFPGIGSARGAPPSGLRSALARPGFPPPPGPCADRRGRGRGPSAERPPPSRSGGRDCP